MLNMNSWEMHRQFCNFYGQNPFITPPFKSPYSRPGEMAQSLTTLAALSEDQCLVPSTYTDGSQLPVAPARGNPKLSLSSIGINMPPDTCKHTYTHTCTHTNKTKINLKEKLKLSSKSSSTSYISLSDKDLKFTKILDSLIIYNSCSHSPMLKEL